MQNRLFNRLIYAVAACGCLGMPAGLQAQHMETVGRSVEEESVRRVLEANLNITEIKIRELQTKVDAMKACYAQKKVYTPTGCAAIPQPTKSCTCDG